MVGKEQVELKLNPENYERSNHRTAREKPSEIGSRCNKARKEANLDALELRR